VPCGQYILRYIDIAVFGVCAMSRTFTRARTLTAAHGLSFSDLTIAQNGADAVAYLTTDPNDTGPTRNLGKKDGHLRGHF
jgi:hypothetical protein